ncbi:MAG: SRPBCC family protein, partial [Steroidobacteraceae bacterium]
MPDERSALFDVAADVEGYPLFLPGWIDARIVRRAGEQCEAVQTIGLGPMRLRFRTQALLRRPERIDITSDLESCPDTSSCRSRQHLPYLGPCKPWGLQGPLGRFAVLRGAAL